MKRKSNRRYYILALIVLLLVLGGGYALLSETLNISGTATTSGEFGLEFNAATVGTPTSNAPGATATISVDKKTLTLAADSLTEPGAIVTYNVTIKNTKTIDAKLENIVITGTDNNDLKVTISPAFVQDTVLNAGATYDFNIVVEWPYESTVSGTTINYTVQLDYEQA